MGARDVLVIGAGVCGLAAARRLGAAGATCRVLEARDRPGGRAAIAEFGAYGPLDVGAHWMHAASNNPLRALAEARGLALRRMNRDPLVLFGTEPANWVTRAKLWSAVERLEDAIAARAASDPDAAAGDVAGGRGHFGRIARHYHGIYSCGMPLEQISAHDFSRAEDDQNRFVAGGYGGLVMGLAAGLPVAFDTPVRKIVIGRDEVRVETAKGAHSAAAVILTVPTTVLLAGGISFEPALPEGFCAALADLPHGTYERAIFSLDGAPFGPGTDRDVILIEGDEPFYILANAEGTGAHFADIPGEAGAEAAAGGAAAMGEIVRDRIARHFGADAVRGFRLLHASGWCADPFTRGAWSVAKPGRHMARETLAEPLFGRMIYAGEATSIRQWGTVGGAFAEGLRAAAAALALIGRIEPAA